MEENIEPSWCYYINECYYNDIKSHLNSYCITKYNMINWSKKILCNSTEMIICTGRTVFIS